MPVLDNPRWEQICRLIRYDADLGTFVWLVNAGRSKAGTIAGSLGNHGYWQIRVRIDKQLHRCLAHRLAWFMTKGHWPPLQIDHINGDKCDNRIANLRLATPQQNTMNSKRRSTNKAGLKGVVAKDGGWAAYITWNGKSHHCGKFATKEAAHAAYLAAAYQIAPDFVRNSYA